MTTGRSKSEATYLDLGDDRVDELVKPGRLEWNTLGFEVLVPAFVNEGDQAVVIKLVDVVAVHEALFETIGGKMDS